MAVTNPETFTLSGPGITANALQIISELAKEGITATGVGPVVITNASLAAGFTRNIGVIHRIAGLQGGTVTYVPAT